MNAVVDLQSLRNTQLAERPVQNVTMGFDTAQGFELMQRAAKAFAASTLVPQQFQGNVPNCLIALEMSTRIGASPLLVAQNLYIVHGRPGWSAKFLIATFNQCGKFSALRYEWQGTKGEKQWGCRAWATEKATGERIQSAWITWELVDAEGWNKKSGSKWLTMPEQMFMYRAAAWLVNTHAPEISMGLNTADEMTDVYDAERDVSGEYRVTTESLRDVEHVIDQEGIPEPPAGNPIPQPTGEPNMADALASVREGDMDMARDIARGLLPDEAKEVEAAIAKATAPKQTRQRGTMNVE